MPRAIIEGMNEPRPYRHAAWKPRPSRLWQAALAVFIVLCLACVGGIGWAIVRPSARNPFSRIITAQSQDTAAATGGTGTGTAGQAQSTQSQPSTDQSQSTQPSTGAQTQTAKPTDPADVAATAKARLAKMSLAEKAGQTMMVPLQNTDDPSTVGSLLTDGHVGSVVLLGQWTTGTAGVGKAVGALQSLAGANNPLLVTVDQEGGLVQHLKGNGFDTMPSATDQGKLDVAALRAKAKAWGAQLAKAGVNVDLAPVTDTVTVADRSTNAPIGALDRDFGLDAGGNAEHASAFVKGMADAGVMATVKHFPGLGGVTGNTDFTAEGIVDATTTADGDEVAAFKQVIDDADPAMVMMALATYTQLDASTPAAFSSTVVDGLLRGKLGYDGVVISDSLSAAAVSGIPEAQLGVRFIQAGGDLVCVGDPAQSQAILDGIVAKAQADAGFAKKVDQAALRVLTLKAEKGLLS